MAVPKKKTSKSKRNMRRSHHALGKSAYGEDTTTGELKRPHHISLDGHYNGRQVLEPREAIGYFDDEEDNDQAA